MFQSFSMSVSTGLLFRPRTPSLSKQPCCQQLAPFFRAAQFLYRLSSPCRLGPTLAWEGKCVALRPEVCDIPLGCLKYFLSRLLSPSSCCLTPAQPSLLPLLRSSLPWIPLYLSWLWRSEGQPGSPLRPRPIPGRSTLLA